MATLTLTGTASLLHNNLALSSSGWAACVHNSVNAGGGKLLLNKSGQPSKDGPEVSQATCIRYLECSIGSVLVVSSTNGTQIYNEDATAMLVYVPIDDAAADADVSKHHQGACWVPGVEHIVIGTSAGSLVPMQTSSGSFMALAESPAPGAHAVADVCYSAITNTVVSAHNNGELRVWQVSPHGPYQNASAIPAAGQAPVRIASLGPRLLVAFGPGTLCLFDAVTYECQVELTAHARWVTAVDVREDLGFVATVGEDTVLNIWQVDASSGRVGLQHTSVVTDKLLTGAAMFGSEVMVTAYDSGELYRVGVF